MIPIGNFIGVLVRIWDSVKERGLHARIFLLLQTTGILIGREGDCLVLCPKIIPSKEPGSQKKVTRSHRL